LCHIEKCHLHHLQDHLMLHNYQHTIPLTYFFKEIIHDGNQRSEMITLIIWNEKNKFQNEHLSQEIWMFHQVFCHAQFCYK
jgi:hypothetical protein